MRMTESQLVNGFRDLMKRLYTREFTQWRRDRFRQNYKAARLQRRRHVAEAAA
jgi:hypothetical protein